MLALLLHFDNHDLAVTCSGLHGYDVAAPHGAGPFSLPMGQQEWLLASCSW